MHISLTSNVFGQRTTRAINSHAYTDGTVFVQCCGCNVFHKLVDNLKNLFHEIKCCVNPSFKYQDPNGNAGRLGLKYLDMVTWMTMTTMTACFRSYEVRHICSSCTLSLIRNTHTYTMSF